MADENQIDNKSIESFEKEEANREQLETTKKENKNVQNMDDLEKTETPEEVKESPESKVINTTVMEGSKNEKAKEKDESMDIQQSTEIEMLVSVERVTESEEIAEMTSDAIVESETEVKKRKEAIETAIYDQKQNSRTSLIINQAGIRSSTSVRHDLKRNFEKPKETVDEKCCCQFQNNIFDRDRIIENLQRSIQLMHCEFARIIHENTKLAKKLETLQKAEPATGNVNHYLQKYKYNADCLEEQLTSIGLTLKNLEFELNKTQMEGNQISKHPNLCVRYNQEKTIEEENAELKKQYTLLLLEYARKERKAKELYEKVSKQHETELYKNSEKLELETYKKQYNDSLDEREKFKVMIKEQARQAEDYREKFLSAQKTIVEQNQRLENIESNNRAIEDQINLEVERIRIKFEDKMKDLIMLPKMLETEQLQYKKINEKNKILRKKLEEAEVELVKAEQQVGKLKPKNNDEAQEILISDLNSIVVELKAEMENMEKECDNLRKNVDDENLRYEILRTEMAKNIKKINEHEQITNQMYSDQISKLENDIAKARADATCEVALKEKMVREIQGQLKILTCNFEDAQKQITALKGHMKDLKTFKGKDKFNEN